MDANFRRDKPGKSPMGMDLVPVYASDSETDDETTVHINPGVEQNLGVRTQAAQIRSLFRRVEATGFVGFQERNRWEDNEYVIPPNRENRALFKRPGGWASWAWTQANTQMERRGTLTLEQRQPVEVACP